MADAWPTERQRRRSAATARREMAGIAPAWKRAVEAAFAS